VNALEAAERDGGSAAAQVQQAPSSGSAARYPLLLTSLALIIVAFLLVRYQGYYVEQDTAETTRVIAAVADAGTVIPSSDTHPVYPSGFAFQSVNVFLMEMSGLSVQQLQSWGWPFMLPFTILMAYLAFREMTRDDQAAALAALLLCLQPDFLFTTLRGSHEKLTYSLVLAGLLLLFRAFCYRQPAAVFARYVFLLYVVFAALVATNSTFGGALVAGLLMSAAGGLGMARLSTPETADERRLFLRLAFVAGSSALLLGIELFYLYPPSGQILDQLGAGLQRIVGLFRHLGTSEHPYAGIALNWRSPWIYLLLNAFDWCVLALSGVVWLAQARRLLRGGWAAVPDVLRLRWLLFGALALEVGFGVVADYSGVLGSNLQLRLLPIFMFAALPTVSGALVGLPRRLPAVALTGPAMRAGLAAAVTCLAAMGALKATNEPILSNKWTFYSAPEAQALDWLPRYLPNGAVWTDVDERLREAYLFRWPLDESGGSRFALGQPSADVPVIMISSITRERLARLHQLLPDVLHTELIYDNGDVQIYHRVPRTPLQR